MEERFAAWEAKNRAARGDGRGATELELSAAQQQELGAWAAEGFPYEVCGVLVGRVDASRVVVERVVRARNLNEERAEDRYQLAPDDFLAADAAARADGWEIVGIWHTHPSAPPKPSLTDLEAAWEGYSYLILSVVDGAVAESRSWRLEDGRFLEEPVLVGATTS